MKAILAAVILVAAGCCSGPCPAPVQTCSRLRVDVDLDGTRQVYDYTRGDIWIERPVR